MGVIRGVLVALASTVFFFAVLSSAVFYTIGSSLNYATVHNQTINIAQQIMDQMNLTQEINSNLQDMKDSCKAVNTDYNLTYQGYTFSIPCEDLNKSISQMISDSLEKFVNSSYYEKYDCNYWDCFDKYPPTFLISEKSRDYWYKLFYFSLSAFLLSSAALFFLIQKKRHLPFLAGIMILVSSAIIFALSRLLSSMSNDILGGIISIFFSRVDFVFIRMLIIGAIIIFAGLAIEFYRAGFKLYNLFSKFRESKKAQDKNKSQKDSDAGKK